MANISGKSTRKPGAGRLLATVLMAGGIVVYAGAAQAGFEFSAPPKAPKAAVAAAPDAVPSVPAGDVDMAPLPDAAPAKPSNVNISAFPMKANAPASPATAPVGASSLALPSSEPQPVPGTPVPVPDGRHAMTAPSMTPPPPAPVSATSSVPAVATPAPAKLAGETGFATVSGFGSDMPLVLAMRQIVPATYAYSFDPSTNPGTRISWEGGRPWDVVLNDALEPYGLKATIVGQAVRVMPASAAVPAAASKTPALTILSGAAPAAEPAPSYPPRVPHKTFASNGMMPMSGAASLPQETADKTMVYPAPTAIMAGTATDEAQQSYPHRKPHRAAADTPAPVPPPPFAQQNDMAPPPVMPLAPAFAPPPPAAQSVQAKAPPSWFYYSGQHRDAVKAAASDDGMMTAPVAPPPAPVSAPPMAAPMAVPMAAPMPIMPPSGPLPAPPLVSQEMSAAMPAPPAAAPPVPLSAADSAAVIPAAGVQTASHPFNAETGQSLKMVLEQWSQQAGVELAWTSITDYNLPRAVHTTGTFADAVKDALMAYQNDPERPIGTLHTNTSNGAPVLEIKSYAAEAGST